jgi:hypothetical protein
MKTLREQLGATLEDNFTRELRRGLERLRQAMAPYQRFVLEEEARLRGVATGLDEISGRLTGLEAAVREAAPEG